MILPVDVYQKIFWHLSLPDLRDSMSVCRRWNQPIASDSRGSQFLWCQLYHRDFYVLVGDFSFKQESNYKNFYQSLHISCHQKTSGPVVKRAEELLTKARAAGTSQVEMASGYDKAIKSLETALKIQAQRKGDTTALKTVIVDLKQQLLIPRIRQEVSLYLPNEEEMAQFNDTLDLYQDQEDPFSCWKDFIKAFEEEGLPLYLRYLTAAVCEHEKDFSTAACHYLELAENHPHPLACLKKAAFFVQKASDPLAYPHFLEKLNREADPAPTNHIR